MDVLQKEYRLVMPNIYMNVTLHVHVQTNQHWLRHFLAQVLTKKVSKACNRLSLSPKWTGVEDISHYFRHGWNWVNETFTVYVFALLLSGD